MTKSNLTVTAPRVSSRDYATGTERTRLAIKTRRVGRQSAIPFAGGKRYHSYQLDGAKPIYLSDFGNLLAQSPAPEAVDYLQQAAIDSGHTEIVVTIQMTNACGDVTTETLNLTSDFAAVITALQTRREHVTCREHRRTYDLLIALETRAARMRQLELEEYDQS